MTALTSETAHFHERGAAYAYGAQGLLHAIHGFQPQNDLQLLERLFFLHDSILVSL